MMIMPISALPPYLCESIAIEWRKPFFYGRANGSQDNRNDYAHYGRWVEQATEEQQHVFVSSFGQKTKEC